MSKLREILVQHGVAQHTVEAVMLAMSARQHRKKEPDAVWGALLSKAKAARMSVTSNRTKRVGQPIAAVYEEYARLVQAAITRIEAASLLVLDDGLPAQPLDLERKRAEQNKRRANTNTPLLPECKADAWHTWIAPDAREALQESVNAHYASLGNPKGKRFTPFVLTVDKAMLAQAVGTLRQEIRGHRAMHKAPDAPDDGGAFGQTRYGALQVHAAARALLALKGYEDGVKSKAIDPIVRPLPADWRQLLDATWRARLRAADDNPAGVELTDYEERNMYQAPKAG